MLKIFLSSHGRLASGMKNAADILLGNTDNVTAYDAYLDESTVREHLDAFFTTVSEEDDVFLLSDLHCGSVNQEMYYYIDRPRTKIITGINLSVLLELLSREKVLDKDLDEIVLSSREMMHVVQKDNEDSAQTAEFF